MEPGSFFAIGYSGSYLQTSPRIYWLDENGALIYKHITGSGTWQGQYVIDYDWSTNYIFWTEYPDGSPVVTPIWGGPLGEATEPNPFSNTGFLFNTPGHQNHNKNRLIARDGLLWLWQEVYTTGIGWWQLLWKFDYAGNLLHQQDVTVYNPNGSVYATGSTYMLYFALMDIAISPDGSEMFVLGEYQVPNQPGTLALRNYTFDDPGFTFVSESLLPPEVPASGLAAGTDSLFMMDSGEPIGQSMLYEVAKDGTLIRAMPWPYEINAYIYQNFTLTGDRKGVWAIDYWPPPMPVKWDLTAGQSSYQDLYRLADRPTSLSAGNSMPGPLPAISGQLVGSRRRFSSPRGF